MEQPNIQKSRLNDYISSLSWGWGETVVALGGVICILASTILPWASGSLTWKGVITGVEFKLPDHSFKLLDTPWLAITAIVIAVLCIMGLLWRKQAAKIAIACSALLFACAVVYLLSLLKEAYDLLRFYNSLRNFVKSIPLIGPVVDSVIRESLIIKAGPQAGIYLFFASCLIILTGGLLIWRRNKRQMTFNIPPPPMA